MYGHQTRTCGHRRCLGCRAPCVSRATSRWVSLNLHKQRATDFINLTPFLCRSCQCLRSSPYTRHLRHLQQQRQLLSKLLPRPPPTSASRQPLHILYPPSNRARLRTLHRLLVRCGPSLPHRRLGDAPKSSRCRRGVSGAIDRTGRHVC